MSKLKTTIDKLEERIVFVTQYYRDNSLQADYAWAKIAPRMRGREIPFWKKRRNILSVAAAVLLLVASSAWWLFNSVAEPMVFQTLSGETYAAVLPDSSRIFLSENSSITYWPKRYGRGERRIALKGKAFFDVTRNEKSPFIVDSRLAETTVLGTSFQINEYAEGLRLDVITGRVAIAIKETTLVGDVSAGETVVYNASDKKLQSQVVTCNENQIAWHTKMLRFRKTPLFEVIEDLESYYNIQLSADTATLNKTLSATFRETSAEQTIQIINSTLDCQIVIKPSNID